MSDTHIHVWTWDNEHPGYHKCRECGARRNAEREEN